ncbi:MAG: hypothetical protein P4N59_07505 [Negativicutes bacterium]|nr:hypothetical protein [Negativicutes bacterium]
MKSSSKLIVALVLILLIIFAFFNCKHVDPPGVDPPQPAVTVIPAVVSPSVAPLLAQGAVKPAAYVIVAPEATGPPAVTQEPILTTKTVQLLRIDFSGVYALPEQLNFNSVLEVYHNGKPVDRGRIAVVENDRIDVWDARTGSRITALVQY